MRLQRVGEGKAVAAFGDRVTGDGVEVGADAVGAALVDRMARLALGEDLFASGRIADNGCGRGCGATGGRRGCGGGHGRGQRQVRTHLVQIEDHVGAIFGAGEAGERHLGAVGKGLGVGQPLVKRGEIPLAALALQRIRKGKAAAAHADRVADHGPQVGTDAVGRALVDGVAGLALGKDCFALGGIGLGQAVFDRLDRGCGACAAGGFDAGDGIAHGFGAFVLVSHEIVGGQAGQTQRHDPAEQGPTGDGIEIVAHACPRMVRAPARGYSHELGRSLVIGPHRRKSVSCRIQTLVAGLVVHAGTV